MTAPKPKLNNRGFSLIELLVGVAILVVVLGPLLYAFITSQRISRSSHDLGEATLVARNVVETIRRNGVEPTVQRIDNIVSGGAGVNPFGATVGIVGFNDSGTGIYTFTLTGVPSGEVGADFGAAAAPTATNTSLLDVEVRIDATRYKSGFDPGAYGGIFPPYPDGVDFNDLEITEYLPMDGTHFQLTGADDPDERAILTFVGNDEFRQALIAYYEQDLIDNYGVDPALAPVEANLRYNSEAETYVRNRMKRDIVFDITRSSPSDDITVHIKYQYCLLYDGVGESFTYITGQTYVGLRDEYTVYNVYNDPIKDSLSIYFFYRPHYKTSTTGTLPNRDDIWINNLDNVPINIFLIKQKPIGPDTNNPFWDDVSFNFGAKEAGYSSHITNRENISFASSGAYALANTKVFTNVRDDLSGNGVNPGSRFERVVRNPAGTLFENYPYSEFNNDLLVSKLNRDRMYDIFIDVYEAGGIGTTDPLISYDATHLD